MPNDRSILGLQIETKTAGQGDIDKLAASVSKLGDSVQKQMERIAKQNDSAAATFRKLSSDAEKSANNLKSVISNPLAAAGTAAESFVLKYGAIGGVVAGAATAMAVGARYIAQMHAEIARAAEGTVNFADRLGLTVAGAEQLSAMARIAGVDVGALEQAARTLAETLQDTTGEGAQLRAQLHGMGVDVQDLSGNQRELGGLLEDVLDKLSHIPSTAERIHRANDLIGRGAVALQPVIKSYADLRKMVTDAGVGLDENLIQKFAKTDDQIGLVGEKFEILKRQLLEPFDYAVNSLAGFLLRGGGPNHDLYGDFSVTLPGGMRVKPSDSRNLLPGIQLVDQLDNDAQKFREANSKTPDALNRQIAEQNKKAAKLTESLSGRLSPESRSALEAQLNSIKAGTKALEDEIERANKRKEIEKSILDLMHQQDALAATRAIGPDAVPALQQLQRELSKDGLTSSDKLKIANAFSPEILAQQTDAEKKGQEIIAKLSREFQSQQLVIRQQGIGFEAGQTVANLGFASRPGEELETQRLIAQVRTDAAKRIFELEQQRIELEHAGDDDKLKFLNTSIDLAKARADKAKEIQDAEADRDAKVLAIERERTELQKQRARDLGIARFADQQQRTQGDAERQIRFLQASARPGQEISTAARVEALRQDAAQKVFELEVQRLDLATRDMDAEQQEAARNLENLKITADLESAKQDASLEYWERVLNLQRRQEEEARDAAGRVFDAITASGKDGLAQLGQSFIKTVERQIFVNITSVAFENARKASSLPGQVDKNGNLTTLGKILQGTPLGVDPLKQATTLNTTATAANTAAIIKWTGQLSGSGGASSLPAIPTLIDRPLLKTPTTFEEGLRDKAQKTIEDGVEAQKQGAKLLEKIVNSKALSVSSTAAFGAAAAVGGFRQGGAQGVLQGAASIAQTVGTVLPLLSKTLSLAGPIGMVAGLGLSLVSGLLPNAKDKFNKEQDAALQKNRFTAPTSTSSDFDFATGGNAVFDGIRGRTNVNVTVINNVSAMDGKSVKDFFDLHGAAAADGIADAVLAGMSPKMTAAARQSVVGPES